MAAKWGLFLCNCRKTLPLDPQRLVLPIAPSVLSFATDPDNDVREFATAVNREQPDQVLIGCCAAPSLFRETLSTAGGQSLKLHFVNLKESCFLAHSDLQQAHAKATRLLRAAVAAAEGRAGPDSGFTGGAATVSFKVGIQPGEAVSVLANSFSDES